MEENQSPVPGSKQDMIDRKGAWIERMFDRLFGAIQKNVQGTILILSVALNFWQFSINNDLQQLRIADITTLNEKINKAVEQRVNSKVTEQMLPIQAQQDSLNKTADTSFRKLNETVNSFKEKYINKKIKK